MDVFFEKIKPPKSQNVLTKIVGRRKHFESKNYRKIKFREESLNRFSEVAKMKRVITIRPKDAI